MWGSVNGACHQDLIDLNFFLTTNRRDPIPYHRHSPPPLQLEQQLLPQQQQGHPKPLEQQQQTQKDQQERL